LLANFSPQQILRVTVPPEFATKQSDLVLYRQGRGQQFFFKLPRR